jgi:hypothetical protein
VISVDIQELPIHDLDVWNEDAPVQRNGWISNFISAYFDGIIRYLGPTYLLIIALWAVALGKS